jgi:Sulfotransferase family
MNQETNEENGKPVIVVSGLPRSGTSMAMQMLDAAGIAIVSDGVREASEDNPKGYYEDERVKRLHKKDEDGTWLSAARGKAVKVISFLLKDLPASNRYKVLFMRRPLGEVLASQRKMLERRGESDPTTDETMFELWQGHLSKVERLLESSSHFEHLDLQYADVVRDPLSQARRIRDFLGLPLDDEVMAAAVDQSLYRNREGAQPGRK